MRANRLKYWTRVGTIMNYNFFVRQMNFRGPYVLTVASATVMSTCDKFLTTVLTSPQRIIKPSYGPGSPITVATAEITLKINIVKACLKF